MRFWLMVAAAMLVAGQAMADVAQPTYAPPADWVKQLPIPKDVPAPRNTPAQVLLLNRQTRLTPQGDEFYIDSATRILSPQGLASVGQQAIVWDPDTEALTIHALKIIRGDQTIDVLAGGKKFTVLRRESNLELSMLDGRLTATIEPEGLQVGDILDISYTVTRHDPALGGHSTHFDQLRHSGVAAHVVMRTVWAANVPVRYRVTEALAQPTVTKTAAGSEVVSDLHDIETPKIPIMAPARFTELGAIEFSDFADWQSLSKLMYPLYAKAETLSATSPLKAEIAKIAALGPDQKVRALAAWRLVEDQTRYVFLGMNDGGLVPADADVTWQRRFGDCKGKTVLLLALLHGLGIKAEPALVNTKVGDGMDQRMPAASWFDHVMVRAEIGGKTYWLDGTRLGDRVLDDRLIPRFGWALPVEKEGAPLAKMSPPPRDKPDVEDTLVIDASKGAETPAPTSLVEFYRGDYASALRSRLASVPREDFERAVRESWSKTYPWLDVDTVTIAEEGEDGTAKITAVGTARLEWSAVQDGSRVYRLPGTAMGENISFKRQPGPDIDAPYQVTYPYYVTYSRRITLPADGDFTLIGVDVDQTVGGQVLKRRSRIENGVLVVDTSDQTIVPEFPSADAETAGVTLRDLAHKDVAIDYRVRPAGAAPQRAANLGADVVAAQRGDGAAAYRVGEAYRKGDEGLPYDPKEAQAMLRKAAEAGNADAEASLGAMMLNNATTPEQSAEAASMVRKSAASGSARGAGLIGWMYLVGRGVTRDDTQGLDWLKLAASKGDATGEYYLATLYLSGRAVPKDETVGVSWMRKSADQGFGAAEAGLANCYRLGAGVAKDPVQMVAWARKAADRGEPQGQILLGAAYENGDGGLTKDPAQAFAYYDKAAGRGSAAGQYQLSRAYSLGVGVAKDQAQAVDWLRKAADQGFADAQVTLGLNYRAGALGLDKDYGQALAWLGKAAAQGDARAETEMGVMAELGQGGQPRDYGQAMGWYLKAAAQGSPVAMLDLGMLYERGQGAPRDFAKAFSWYEQASAAGNVRAKANLAALYVSGRGVQEDDARAVSLAREAAEHGEAHGMFLLGTLYQSGKGVAADDALAFTWFSRSATAGDLAAAAAVGVLYAQGKGVAANPVQALHWLTAAAQAGVPAGQYNLALLYEKGAPGVPRDAAAALRWYTLAAEHGFAPAQIKLAQLGAPGARLPAPPPLNIAPVANPTSAPAGFSFNKTN